MLSVLLPIKSQISIIVFIRFGWVDQSKAYCTFDLPVPTCHISISSFLKHHDKDYVDSIRLPPTFQINYRQQTSGEGHAYGEEDCGIFRRQVYLYPCCKLWTSVSTAKWWDTPLWLITDIDEVKFRVRDIQPDMLVSTTTQTTGVCWFSGGLVIVLDSGTSWNDMCHITNT